MSGWQEKHTKADLAAHVERLEAEIARLTAERDAAMAGRVKVTPLAFEWVKDESKPNPSWWRCDGEGFFAYVLIPYDPGNDPAAGTGKWNANPNHRGRMGFETREAAMAYCEETIRQQAINEVNGAIATLSLWTEAALQPDTDRAEPVAGALFIDQDGDVCINDGRKDNLVFCPAADEHGKPLCPDVVAEIVRRFNTPQPAPARQAREITVQEAAEVKAHGSNGERKHVYDACEGRCKVYKFDAVLRAIAAMQKGG